MNERFETAVLAVEAAVVLLLLIGLTLSTGRFLYRPWGGALPAYRFFRQELGHSLLLTLEFLIAADIIHTVAVDQTFTSLGILGLLVLIRTFLSFTLELEISGRWPWQDRGQAPAGEWACLAQPCQRRGQAHILPSTDFSIISRGCAGLLTRAAS